MSHGELSERQFKLGDWLVDPKAGRLIKQGAEIRLEPRVMDVLLVMADHHQQVVSREEMEAAAWPGMVVGYDALTNSVNKLRKALGDHSRQPKYIETVSKKGYRLVAPLEMLHESSQKSLNRSSHREIGISTKYLAIVSAIGIVALMSFALLKFGSRQATEAQNKTGLTSLAVLPFANLSGDAKQDYFSDGITADLITDLSKLSELFVIARNSAFIYKGRIVKAQEAGRELGVRFVLQGSVRRSGGQVRITAQLTDVQSDFILWAERFDGDMKDVFSLQDSVNEKIVQALKLKISLKGQKTASRQTNSVEAYDLFLKGWQHFWRFNKEDNQTARELYRDAIRYDENFARAYANLSLTYAYDISNGWSDDVKESREQAYLFARKAVELDPGLPQVHWSLGTIDLFSQRYDQAIKSAKQVIQLSPNSADGYGLLAATLNFAGDPHAAEPKMRQAMRLNPLYPFIYLVILGEIQFNKQAYGEAVESFTLATQRNPEAQEARLWLAASLAYLGRIDEAQWQLMELRQLNPELSAGMLQSVVPFKLVEQRRHFIQGLKQAGMEIQHW